MAQYHTMLTDIGRAKLTHAIAHGGKVELTAMAVGDGGGNPVTPTGGMTSLVNEVYKAAINNLEVDPDNSTYVRADLVIPVTEGGWHIREVGVFDSDNDLFAVGNVPESYKPALSEGVGSDFYVRLLLDVSNAELVTLNVDPAIILVTKKELQEHEDKLAGSGRYGHMPNLRGEKGDVLTVGHDGNYSLSSPYIIGEFYEFRHPALRPGFKIRNGEVLTDAHNNFPRLYEYLQTEEGQILCKTEAQWQAMSAEEPWIGVGGVPFYVIDITAKTIRLPDTRGMYSEDAGFDGLEVGGVHGDAIRNITGTFGGKQTPTASGVFVTAGQSDNIAGMPSVHGAQISFDPSRIVPTANKNQPRAFGVLPCVYVGGK